MSPTSPAHPPVTSLDTPCLVLDLDAMERNLQRMAEYAARRQLRLRPHAKMHKSAQLALMQMQAGAVGVCVQKTGEAQRLADLGVPDIFISNQVIAPAKLDRVARMAQVLRRQHGPAGRLGIAVDSAVGISHLAQAQERLIGDPPVIDVYVEIDVGQARCGVPPGTAAVSLAQQVMQYPRLRFAGLQAYQGKAQHLRSVASRQASLELAAVAVQHTLAAFAAAGLKVPLVTGAGTGSFPFEADSGLWGELQPGSYLFMDADYAQNEAWPGDDVPRFEQALFLRTQVISVSSGHVVCDAGHKSHAIDAGLPTVHPEGLAGPLVYANGGDEHGILRGPVLPTLGDIVWLVPGHCDPTVNLHEQLVGVRGGLSRGVVERVIRVNTRGAFD